MRYLFAILLLFTSSFALDAMAAKKKTTCAEDMIQPQRRLKKNPDALDLETARQIVGDASAPDQIFSALRFLGRQSYQNYLDKTADLETLFVAINHSHFLHWSFIRFTGPSGETGFLGEKGHFVLIEKDGRVFKGKMDYLRAVNHKHEWNGTYIEMFEVVSK